MCYHFVGSRPGSRCDTSHGGKSGLHRAGCQVTPGRREPTESATENIPPVLAQVRVKWCGKSAPRGWQQPWQGKPHPEQDQIGEHWRGPRCSRVGRSRCTATCIPDEWLSTTEPGLQADFLFNLLITPVNGCFHIAFSDIRRAQKLESRGYPCQLLQRQPGLVVHE